MGWVIVTQNISLNGEISKNIIFDATHMLSTYDGNILYYNVIHHP